MEKANSLVEIYKNFAETPLQPHRDEAIYVPLFAPQLKRLEHIFLNSVTPSEYVYVAGQSGVGKTSALNFFCDSPRIKGKYDILAIYANEQICANADEIDVVTLLIQLGFCFLDKEPALKPIFEKELHKIKDKAAQKYSEENTENTKHNESREFGFGFKLSLPTIISFFSPDFNLKANLKNDKETQQVIKHFFSFSKEDLRKMIDKMAEKYQEIHSKPLLIVIHDLERMKNYDAIKSLFVENRQYFQMTKCRKILSLPAALIAENLFTEDKELFALKVAPNPIVNTPDDKTKIEATYTKFEELTYARIDKAADLIETKAIRKAFELSGGVIRQFMHIIRRAAQNVDINEGVKISEQDVEEGGVDFTSSYLQPHAISGSDFDVMDYVDEHHTSNFDDKLKDNFGVLVQSNKIFAYKNGINWFAINPLLRQQFDFMKRSRQPKDAK